jgi:hypothetical protein
MPHPLRLKPTFKPANIVMAALLPLHGINSEEARLSAGEQQQPHVLDVSKEPPNGRTGAPEGVN